MNYSNTSIVIINNLNTKVLNYIFLIYNNLFLQIILHYNKIKKINHKYFFFYLSSLIFLILLLISLKSHISLLENF